MVAAHLAQLRIPAFKSVRGATVPLGPLTLLVGRNGSGKSNVIDAVAVLSALASGVPIRDALDGGREGPLIRGGSEGCAPVGEDSFKIGCTASIRRTRYCLDLEVAVRPTVQVVSERLWTRSKAGPRRGEQQDLLRTDKLGPDSGDIVARWDNRKPGPNPAVTFRATQLLTAQVATRVPATSQAGRHVRDVAEQMLNVMSEVFILDPVPQQMREYVPDKDVNLRRNADNLSAVLADLSRDAEMQEALHRMTESLSEAQVSELGTARSDLGDVMTTVRERVGATVQSVPARLMSDGTLRFLAIAAALLHRPRSSGESDRTARAERLLVVEEIENGLHPSQAALLLDRLKESAESGVRTLATTHSPAILDALAGDDHQGVMVCNRDDDGWSRVSRLTDFPDYFEIVGRGPLGTAAERDRLRTSEPAPAEQRPLAEVLGL